MAGKSISELSTLGSGHLNGSDLFVFSQKRSGTNLYDSKSVSYLKLSSELSIALSGVLGKDHHVYLTKAQYNALTPAQRNDEHTVWCVTDDVTNDIIIDTTLFITTDDKHVPSSGLVKSAITAASGTTCKADELKSDITTIKTDVGAIKTKVNSIETNITDIKTKVTGIDTKVTNIQGDITDVKTNIEDIQTSITDITTRINNIEGESFTDLNNIVVFSVPCYSTTGREYVFNIDVKVIKEFIGGGGASARFGLGYFNPANSNESSNNPYHGLSVDQLIEKNINGIKAGTTLYIPGLTYSNKNDVRSLVFVPYINETDDVSEPVACTGMKDVLVGDTTSKYPAVRLTSPETNSDGTYAYKFNIKSNNPISLAYLRIYFKTKDMSGVKPLTTCIKRIILKGLKTANKKYIYNSYISLSVFTYGNDSSGLYEILFDTPSDNQTNHDEVMNNMNIKITKIKILTQIN